MANFAALEWLTRAMTRAMANFAALECSAR